MTDDDASGTERAIDNLREKAIESYGSTREEAIEALASFGRDAVPALSEVAGEVDAFDELALRKIREINGDTE